MNTKILIIGQAPTNQPQKVPYDTTLLYDMLGWVGITKEQAQDMFDFDALVDKFPGLNNDGHLIPKMSEIQAHYRKVLKPKIQKADKIIVLGRIAEGYIRERESLYPDKEFLYMIHPSRRNYAQVHREKEQIIKKLKQFI